MATFEENILAYLDGSLAEDQREELLRAVSSSPDKRRLLDAHIRLRDLLANSQRPQSAPLLVQRELAEKLPFLASRIPALAGGAASSLAVRAGATGGVLQWFSSLSSSSLSAIVVGGALVIGGSYYAISHSGGPHKIPGITKQHETANNSVGASQAGQSKLTAEARSSGKTSLSNQADRSDRTDRTYASDNADLSDKTTAGKKDLTSSRTTHNTTLSLPAPAKTHTTSGHSSANAVDNSSSSSSLAHEKKLRKNASALASNDQSSTATANSQADKPGHSPSSIDPLKADLKDEASSTAISNIDAKNPRIAAANDRSTPIKLSIDEEEQHYVPLRSYAFLRARMMLVPGATSSEHLTPIAIKNGTFSIDPMIALDYELSPWVSLTARIGYTHIAQIQPVKYSEKISNYAYLQHNVNDAAVVTTQVPTIESGVGYLFDPGSAFRVSGYVTAGVALLKNVSPIGSIDLSGSYDLSKSIMLRAGLGYDMSRVKPANVIDETNSVALTTTGEVSRGVTVAPLTAGAFSVSLGLQFHP